MVWWPLGLNSENTISMLLSPPRTGLCQALGPALCITHMSVLKYNFGETVACHCLLWVSHILTLES